MYGLYRRDIRAARPRIPSRHQMGTSGEETAPTKWIVVETFFKPGWRFRAASVTDARTTSRGGTDRGHRVAETRAR